MGSDSPGRASDDEDVVRPEELDFTRDERVSILREGRYVVATGGQGRPTSAPQPDRDSDSDSPDAGSSDAASDERSPGELLEELGDKLDRANQSHGFAIAALFDDEVARRAVLSDDLAATFGELVTWAASRVDDDTPPEVVLGIMLLASGRTVRYPVRAFNALLAEHDLSYDDSIGDLVDSLAAEGFTVPADAEDVDR